MEEYKFTSLCARINSSLEVKKVIEHVGFHPDKAVKAGGLWRLFCPIHGEEIFRTLVLNPRRNTYHCEHTACPAHQPGDMIDLLARVKRTSREYIVGELLAEYGAQRLRLTPQQEEELLDYIASVDQAEAS